MRDVISAKEKRPAITKEQLFETCNKYFEQHGKEPSQKVIQEIIGGSAGTIGPLLRAWKEKKEHDEQAILVMPDHIRDGGMAIIATWWQSIQPTINDMMTSAQLLADDKVKKAEEKCKDAITKLTEQEEKNDELTIQGEEIKADYQQQLEALMLELAKSQSAHDKQRTEKEDLKVKLARVEGERDALKQLLPQKTKPIKADNTLSE